MNDASRAVRLIPFGPNYRASGVLLHITSLSSPYGIGDLGPAAFAMVDRLQAAGQGWWQALPLGPTGYGNSPYQSLSSFAGNGLLISPDGLIEEGLLRASDCDEGRSFPRKAVDYKAVIPFKNKLFEIAWNTFRAMSRSALRLEYDQFCVEQAHWLDDYALFRALKVTHGDVCYLEWPEELVRRESVALARARRDLTELIGQVRFAQFLLFRQGDRLREYARAKGIHLIGDLPFSFRQTRATCGPTRNCFCWMNVFGRDLLPASRPTISACKGNCGETRSMIGRRFGAPVTGGASTACEHC